MIKLATGSDGERMPNLLDLMLIGLVVGVAGKWLMPRGDPGGFVATILLGIAGALLLGLVGEALHWYDASAAWRYGAAVTGALLLLAVYRLVMSGRTRL